MSAHLERESGPLRFIVHAVSLHRHHMDELDVPFPWRADDEARDALCIAPRPNFWYPRGVACSTGDHELLGDRLTIHETPERDRIAHNYEIGVCERHDLGRISEHGFERSCPQVADLEHGLHVLLIALARILRELAVERARRKDVGNSVFLEIRVEILRRERDLARQERSAADVRAGLRA